MSSLADALKTTEAKVETAIKAAKLSGDEMVSLAYAYGFDYDGAGAGNDRLIARAFYKVKAQLAPKKKSKK